MRLGDIARIMPVSAEAMATRSNQERSQDPTLVARSTTTAQAKGQVSGKAVTQARKDSKAADVRNNKQRKRRRWNDDFLDDDEEEEQEPHGPLANLYSVAVEKHNFDASA